MTVKLLALGLACLSAASAATSYANTLGTGDRRGSVVISFTRGVFQLEDVSYLINGVTNGDDGLLDTYVPNGTGFQSKSITFDFRTGKIVDEIRLVIAGANDQATWQPSGSNDGENFTNIGSPVAFTVATPSIFAFTNSTSYRYYRITGSSGTVSQNYWRELEFKLEDGDSTYASSTSYSNTGGTGNRTSSITVTDPDTIFTGTGPLSELVNGANEDDLYVASGTGFQTKSVVFDFGAGNTKIIDEIKLYVPSAKDQATWQVAGSANGSSWTNIGSAKTFPLVGVSRIISFFNLTAYRYYRITGDSGTVDQDYWREVDFRTLDGPAASNSKASVTGSVVGKGNKVTYVQ